MSLWKLSLLLLLTASFAFTGCSDDDDPVATEDPPAEFAYVGSEACNDCHHTSKFNEWVHSGHPYKLTKIDGNNGPTSFPDPSSYNSDPTDPPGGTPWSDYSYTIGGFGWKMRWIQNDGFIYTPASGLNQYNFETESWSNYHAGESKPYNCGSCHTTGWVDSDDSDATNNQDGMVGFLGTFVEGGIGCENCHGMGNKHIFDPSTFPLEIDDTSYLCGKCHTRGGTNGVIPDEGTIEAGGWAAGVGSANYIKHHEQYDEWYNSPHNSLHGPGCNDCHDVHASTRFDAIAPGTGVVKTCESCHVDGDYADILTANHHGADCVDCHMPDASKSAIANNDHNGDVMTHLWTINTSVNGKADMFSVDGTSVVIDNGIASVTLDFACYGCHIDSNGEGGTGSEKSLQELHEKASNIHTYVTGQVAVK